MINIRHVKEYCSEDISLIENYDKAVSDTTQMWHCHHRLETDENKSAQQLIKEGRYFGVMANELIFLTSTEHNSLHRKDKPGWNKGKHLSPEHRQKISEANKGKHHSEAARQKISEAKKEKIIQCMANHHLVKVHFGGIMVL